jgi:hypothetical protein
MAGLQATADFKLDTRSNDGDASAPEDEQLADLVMELRAEDRLCIVSDSVEAQCVRIKVYP